MPSLTINQLDELAQEQRARFLARPLGTAREVPLKRYLAHDRVVAITGVRRCGKSTLLRQAADTLPPGPLAAAIRRDGIPITG